MSVSVRLTARPLSIPQAWRELEGPGTGAVVVFAGRVRADAGRLGRVLALVYEAHEGPALARFRALESRARRRFGVTRSVIWHRVGRLRVGEVSVIVGVASPHRAAAFRAARDLIEELKVTVPIWKTERARPVRRPRRPRDRRAGRSAG